MGILLTDEEMDGLSPTEKEVDDYLATPDDEVAANFRKTLDAERFRYIGKQILFQNKVAKAQLKKVVEWLMANSWDDLCEELLPNGSDYQIRCIDTEDWQALLKEVGD